jgi:hypothetical protein
MFVQFLTKTGAATEPAFGRDIETGRYVATATVPPGGIGGIRPGLRGTTDIYFPIENDPFRAELGVVCDVRAVSGALHRFKGAFNTGDMPGLEGLFSQERFVWFSSTRPGLRANAAARNRGTLIAYFRARHRMHDRVLSFRFRFNGFDAARSLGHFELTGMRRADDFRAGEGFPFAGKGALDCAGRRARIAVLSIATR